MSTVFYKEKECKVFRDKEEIPIKTKVDVLVCGGGPAGIGAALGAADGLASVMIIEKEGCLGGLATCGLVTTFASGSIFSDSVEQGYTGEPARRQVIGGVTWKFVQRLIQNNGASDPEELHKQGHKDFVSFDPEVYKRTADEYMEEMGVNLLFHTLVTGVIKEGNRVKGIVIENKAGTQAILADVIVDATGDADIAAMAGTPFKLGRKEDQRTQPITLMFRMGGMPEIGEEQVAKFSKYPKGEVDRYFLFWEEPLFQYGHVCVFGLPRKGEYRCEMTRAVNVNGLDPDDLTRAEIECRKQIPQIIEYFRKEFPGAENAYLIDSASMIGVQDTRRIVGEYVLTEQDLLECRKFEDTIALGCYSIDYHNPMGRGYYMEQIKHPGQAYSIPYRCLVPKETEGVLVAGKCISTDVLAQTAIRIASECMATGNAAGEAAAICVRDHVNPRDVDVKRLQESLLRHGAILE